MCTFFFTLIDLSLLTLGRLTDQYAPTLRQRRLRWFGHFHCMKDGRVRGNILYGELATGRRSTGCPHLGYKDVHKRESKALDIDKDSCPRFADGRSRRRSSVKTVLNQGKGSVETQARREEHNNSVRLETTHR